jgi:hypothetical protein
VPSIWQVGVICSMTGIRAVSPPGLGEQVVDALGPACATELTLDIVRNAANKIAVAFDVDDPQVETGVEYYDIDVSTGELRYNVSPVTPSA